jgi:cell division protein FtsW (lipid II flippase)
MSDWSAANSMRRNVSKTRVVSYCRKKNVLSYEYQLCHAAITRTSSIKGLGVFFDSKLHFHNHVDFIFSECIKLFGFIRSLTFRFSSLDCLYLLYFTSLKSKLEYASVVWNSITSTDANKLERIKQKFASVCFYRFSPLMFLTDILLP